MGGAAPGGIHAGSQGRRLGGGASGTLVGEADFDGLLAFEALAGVGTLMVFGRARDPGRCSHALLPEAVLHVFERVQRRASPPAFLLAVRGEAFELGEPLSEAAARNLDAAAAFLSRLVGDPRPEAWGALAAV